MQKELLLEIFSEEIPARLQKKALQDSNILMEKLLDEYGAVFGNVTSYISVRRIAIKVDELENKTRDLYEEKRGPKISAPEKAIEGFLKTNNKTKKDLEEKNGYYYLHISTPESDIKEIIPEIIKNFIERFPWPKTMHWYIEQTQDLSAFWIRPIRSILCIYNGAPIKTFIESVGIETSEYTYGHRFLSTDPIRVFDFDDYAYKLEKNFVMLDYSKKADYIDFEMAKKVAEVGLAVQIDESLIYEVAGLVEYPFIHVGAIDEKFMHLPKEVLSTSMKVHQKYFTLTYPDSTIAPFYGTVTNIPGTTIMHEGLDRVLRARLSDAAFFFKEDTDISIDAFAQRLSNVVFHEKLGNVGQKVDRMLSIAETKEENRAISLCKADLVTQMVGEFPELQGIMGAIYASLQEESSEVVNAIRDHYKPNGANDSMPDTNIGARISFFDKLDTLVGFIGIGIYPTGSRDPFALRRAAFSIVRLICDKTFDVLSGEKLSYYVETLITAYSDQGIAIEQETSTKILLFIIERLKVYMIEKLGINNVFVESIINSYKDFDFDYRKAIEKATTIEKLSKLEEFEIIQNAYKRVKGVLASIVEFIPDDIRSLTFDNQYMTNIQQFALSINISTSFEEVFNQIVTLSKLILEACDNIMILSPDQTVKEKNVKLLSEFIKIVKTTIGEISL